MDCDLPIYQVEPSEAPPDRYYEFRLERAIEELIAQMRSSCVVPACKCDAIPLLLFRSSKPKEIAWLLVCLKCDRFLRAPSLQSLFELWRAGETELREVS